MPCQGGPSNDSKIYDDFDKVTQLLCSLCKITNKKKMPPDVLAWWTQHQIEDKEREAEEAAERRAIAKKVKALKKLSKEERQLLGI